ncbi:MAG: acyltransferase [Pseudomonadota bacterium]
MSDTSTPPVYKKDTSRLQRLFRLLIATFDPRAWAHLAKLVNYYNYTNVSEVRKLTCGQNVRISPTTSFANAENIVLGDHCRIGAGASLWAGPGQGKITLGEHCVLAPNVMMTAANYDYNAGSPFNDQPMKEANITVGRDVWLGYGVVVLAGAQIGDGAIIGAGAVARGIIPAGAIVVAAPAQTIGQRTGFGSDAPGA